MPSNNSNLDQIKILSLSQGGSPPSRSDSSKNQVTVNVLHPHRGMYTVEWTVGADGLISLEQFSTVQDHGELYVVFYFEAGKENAVFLNKAAWNEARKMMNVP